jgi:hypothetical protein
MTDPTAQGQPSPEELQAYLEQLRAADVTEVIAQAFNMLGTGANVKLGRLDARVVIDALDALANAVDGRIDADVMSQMRAGIAQLKTAQVEAEREEAARGAGEPQAGAPQAPGDAQGAPPAGAGQAPGGPSPGSRPGGPQQPGGDQKMTDRLWIPGRGPAGPGTPPG